MSEPQNQGTGAGGSNTKHNSIVFELNTDNKPQLLLNEF